MPSLVSHQLSKLSIGLKKIFSFSVLTVSLDLDLDLDSNLFGLGLDLDSNLFGLGLDLDSNLLDSDWLGLEPLWTWTLPWTRQRWTDYSPNTHTHTWSSGHTTHLEQWAHTHTPGAVETHTHNTHLEQWAVNAAAPGGQLGVRCLLKGLTSGGQFLPEPRTHNLRLQVQCSIH